MYERISLSSEHAHRLRSLWEGSASVVYFARCLAAVIMRAIKEAGILDAAIYDSGGLCWMTQKGLLGCCVPVFKGCGVCYLPSSL